jgi:hypothetical protein
MKITEILIRRDEKSMVSRVSVEGDIGWLNRAIETPLIRESKEEVPMWAFCSISSAASPVSHYGDAPLFRPIGENMGNVLCVVIDYDHGANYDNIKGMLGSKKLLAVMHTSYNHSESENRFRVILPLSDPFMASRLRGKCFRQALNDMFPSCDEASTTIGRFFKVPACSGNNIGLYRHDSLEGRLLSPFDWAARFGVLEAEEAARRSHLRSRDVAHGFYAADVRNDGVRERKEGAKEYARSVIRSMGPWDNGNGNHASMCRLNGWLRGVGLSAHEREGLLVPLVPNSVRKEVMEIVVGI